VEPVTRILELAPAGSYDGTTASGEICSVLVQAVDEDRVLFSLHSSSCPECANLGDGALEFTVSPPKTALSSWVDTKDTVSFSVQNEDMYGELDFDVAITNVATPQGSIKVTSGKRTIQCDKLKRD